MSTFKSFLVLAVTAGVALGQFCEHQWKGKLAKRSVNAAIQLPAMQAVPPPPLEIKPLIMTGASSNRVDLIFFGDGYTQKEKDKFFTDAMFLAKNLTDGQTFADVLPLLNFWAGFTPSVDSGIGVNDTALNTVFGLYRIGTTLRAVVTDKADVGHAACDSTTACDFPIILGNSPLYGGLGGDLTIVTASPNNGPVVLRHELGHSIIDVGEEYDGADIDGYFGVNSAPSPDNVPWKQWYTNPSAEPKIQRSNLLIQDYSWAMLNTSQSFSRKFTSPGTYQSYQLQVSLSGMTSSSDLRVEIDGNDIGWQWNPAVGVDRYIYNIKFDKALSPGEHNVSFTLLNAKVQGSAQLANFQILEYGDEKDFNFSPGFHGLYPTYTDKNQTTYRPTNDDCLMRRVYSTDFCDACKEGLWLSLLKRVSFIENVTQTAQPDGSTNATLDLIPLAEHRRIPNPHKEAYTIHWYDTNNNTLEAWTNRTSALIPPLVAEFGVEVRFWTDQVRVDSDGVLVQKKRFTVSKEAGV